MGLTKNTTGRAAFKTTEKRVREDGVTIALAGNPNVGKSSVFNRLTGSRQHTGNWAGKTVVNARGSCRSEKRNYDMVDIPGTYSLLARSAEEEIARDFICFGGADAVVLVCDGTNLPRSMNLLLQVMESTPRVLLCVNLMDEVRRKGIRLDLPLLAGRLGIPVIGISSREQISREQLLQALDAVVDKPPETVFQPVYPATVEMAVSQLLPVVSPLCGGKLSPRWLSLRLLEGDESILEQADRFLDGAMSQSVALREEQSRQRAYLKEQGLDSDSLSDLLAETLVRAGEKLCRGVISAPEQGYSDRDRRIDHLVTGRWAGYPLMLLLLALVLYITIAGANYLSDGLAALLFSMGEKLDTLFLLLMAPAWLRGLLVDGAYRVLAWVVSVMLPPMAIFFPLFTLLEDLGYLPRVAFNLDRPFQRCGACGKMGLTMCMGFGCNAAGVVGCRIIDSERERLLAVLTNSLVPCNGRFPMLITVLSMFFTAAAADGWNTLLCALLLTGLILVSVLCTLLASRLLTATVLKGKPSSFVLELPPYRRPQIGSVLLHSLLDRTLFVLGRAAAVALPAGMLLWIMANIQMDGISLMARCAALLDPLGRFVGMDGVILLAFLLGLPANETVLPIILMAYTAQGSLQQLGALSDIRLLLVQNGWTGVTALCVLLFTLLHWPCSTTLLTIRREAGSWKWAGLAALIPTLGGLTACTLVAATASLLGI
ncbi:MAG: ferrous iron transport protein B [Oscillospiraceae bacterium]|nr:ferrous iron transport protein B [Oscillospiraceae bacterium]